MWLKESFQDSNSHGGEALVSIMAESYSTSLEWKGSGEIGKLLAELIPSGIDFELVEEGDSAKLIVNVVSDNLEALRISVDSLLTLFSDQDQ